MEPKKKGAAWFSKICEKCGKTRGEHRAGSLECPSGVPLFIEGTKFQLKGGKRG